MVSGGCLTTLSIDSPLPRLVCSPVCSARHARRWKRVAVASFYL
jgi:hypothetical protein